MLQEARIDCPYCGQAIVVLVDCTAGDQSYIEDCHVCCQPIRLDIGVAAGGELDWITVTAEQA